MGIVQIFRQGERINRLNYKFFYIMNGVYIVAIGLHFLLMLAFRYFNIPFMVYFNLLVSIPFFFVAFIINRRGLHNTAFTLAVLEVVTHQALGVYFLGFESGLQYFLMLMPLMAFFNRGFSFLGRLILVGLTAVVLVALILVVPSDVYSYSGQYAVAIKALKGINALSTLVIISLVAYHFVQITYKAEHNLRSLNRELRDLNNTMRQKNHEIEQQANVLGTQKRQIISSINYALHIQNALLPNQEILKNYIHDYFIMLRPRDIVSGDFYWFYSSGNKFYLLAADATGHGVPGAFMSVMGLSYLKHIVLEENSQNAANMLESLRKQVKSSLMTNNKNSFKDGFDLSLLIFDFEDYTYSFSAAYNPVYIIRNQELYKLEGDRQPVGIHPKETPFTEKTGHFRKGDVFYLASDGFSDQLGGPDDRKYTKKRLRSKLTAIAHEQLSRQYAIMEEELEEWMKQQQQIDDILLIGLKM